MLRDDDRRLLKQAQPQQAQPQQAQPQQAQLKEASPQGPAASRGGALSRTVRIAPRMMVCDGLQLQRRLGKGGMGTVWVAHNSKLDTQVAVKFIGRYLLQARPESLKRFQREARVAAQLSCPHVVRTQDYGALSDGTPYLVMELLKGESLQQRLRGGGSLTPRQTALVVSQTALALQEAHDRGIIHRDIKPANLFLQKTRYDIFVKLLDFGIAKDTQLGLQQLTQTGSVLGSPRYMSPEQLVNDADWRADLWSLAAVAYRCLAGRAPFAGDDLIGVARNVLSGSYEPVRRHVPSLPAALDGWFACAFHEDIARRPQSAERLAESFEEVLGEQAAEGGSMRARSGRSADMSRARALLDRPAEDEPEARRAEGAVAAQAGGAGAPVQQRGGVGTAEQGAAIEPPPESLSEEATVLRVVPRPVLPARRSPTWRRWLLVPGALVLLVTAHAATQPEVRVLVSGSAGLSERLAPLIAQEIRRFRLRSGGRE